MQHYVREQTVREELQRFFIFIDKKYKYHLEDFIKLKETKCALHMLYGSSNFVLVG